jgi:hypothetical protein
MDSFSFPFFLSSSSTLSAQDVFGNFARTVVGFVEDSFVELHPLGAIDSIGVSDSFGTVYFI